MKSIDVLIIIENKNRELETALLLKKLLVARGYTCELCQQGWSISSARFKWAPKVIVTPWCYDEKDFALMCSFKSGREDGKLAIVNLHCEQLVFQDALEFYIPKEKAAEVFHCAWGPYYKDVLENAGVSSELVEVTGSPRLDFFRKEFLQGGKAVLGNRYGLDPEKKWVMFVGNFSGAFLSDEMIESLDERGIHGWEERRVRSNAAYKEMLAWMGDAANSSYLDGKTEFIYRPHPSEPVTKQLQALDKQNSNITVIKELSIREWYQACDIAFTWCSTSSVEAVCAGIPIYAIEPFEIPDSDVIDIVQRLDKLKSSAEVIDLVYRLCCGEELRTSEEFVEDVANYYRIDAELATIRTADLVIKAIQSTEHSFETQVPTAWAIWMLSKCVVKTALLKIGILGHIEKFRTWIDNYASREDFEHASVVVNRYPTSGRNRG